jgi:hypothetical protein
MGLDIGLIHDVQPILVAQLIPARNTVEYWVSGRVLRPADTVDCVMTVSTACDELHAHAIELQLAPQEITSVDGWGNAMCGQH